MEKNVDKTMMEKLPKILAVDFDGTLVDDAYPNIGEKNEEVFESVLYIKKQFNWKIVLWTCRDGERLAEAVEYCKQQGLEFDAVNENIEEVKQLFNNDTRKVYANAYVDDKAIVPIPGFNIGM